MPHVLHLIKDPANRTALDVIAQQAADSSVRLSIVLLQDAATRLKEALPGDVCRLDEGQAADGSPHPAITHAQLLELIFTADTVVTW